MSSPRSSAPPTVLERSFAGRGPDADLAAEEVRARRTLAAAVEIGEPDLFTDYVRWLRALAEARGASNESVRRLLDAVGRAAAAGVSPGDRDRWLAVLGKGLSAAGLENLPAPAAMPAGSPLTAYVEALLAADRSRARRIVREALAAGASASAVIFEILQPAQREIGRRWLAGEVSVALEHLATATTGQVLGELYAEAPRRAANGRKVVTVCAPGELHEIGARIVADVLEWDGFDSLYVGADTPVDDALDLLAEVEPHLLAISVTLAANLLAVVKLHRIARERLPGLRVIVGGNVFVTLPGLWRRLGADATATDASEVPALAADLCGLARNAS